MAKQVLPHVGSIAFGVMWIQTDVFIKIERGNSRNVYPILMRFTDETGINRLHGPPRSETEDDHGFASDLFDQDIAYVLCNSNGVRKYLQHGQERKQQQRAPVAEVGHKAKNRSTTGRQK